jgi:hypothetical protein
MASAGEAAGDAAGASWWVLLGVPPPAMSAQVGAVREGVEGWGLTNVGWGLTNVGWGLTNVGWRLANVGWGWRMLAGDWRMLAGDR